MNEMTTNHDSMYQNILKIQELNQVDGFDPRRYMRLLTNEGQAARYYLDVVYRKLWFRLKYPNGKTIKTLKKLTDQVAIVEARVYLDRNDPEESFISNALAQKYMSADDQFGNKYVELAETAAVGRALSDAGFGLQFADLEGETDPNIVDAGLEPIDELEAGRMLPADKPAFDLPSGQKPEPMGGQADKQNPSDTGANLPPAMQQGDAPNMSPLNQQGTANGQQVHSQTTAVNTQEAISRIQRNLPVEQIYKMLNRDMAASLVISAGCFKDKLTLGQLAVEKPQSLSWYINDYKGPDNLLRAAARFLLDMGRCAA